MSHSIKKMKIPGMLGIDTFNRVLSASQAFQPISGTLTHRIECSANVHVCLNMTLIYLLKYPNK